MRVRFGDIVVDASTRQVVNQHGPLRLSPKAFDLLMALVAARPRAVRKTQLYDLLWPDTFVTDANLPMLVREIRAALGDSPAAPVYIRTVPRFGYAFCGSVTEDDGDGAHAGTAPRAWLLFGRERIALTDGTALLGRDPSCGVWINAPGVSRRHARIVVSGSQLTIEDLDSKNGTFVDGRRLSAPCSVGGSCELRLGSLTLTLSPATQTNTETERSTAIDPPFVHRQ